VQAAPSYSWDEASQYLIRKLDAAQLAKLLQSARNLLESDTTLLGILGLSMAEALLVTGVIKPK
jgi:hypothetical protein